MLLLKRLKPALLLIAISMLTACGGGGGSDDGGGGTKPPPANVAPSANAGSDQTVDENAEVTLSGTGSDSDGSIASYTWIQTTGTSVTLTNANSASATFTSPDINTDETLTFELKVTDDDGATGSDSISVSVNYVNLAPTANAGADQTVDENTEVTLSGTGSDSDGSIASYTWIQTTGTSVTLTNANSASATFTAPDISADETLLFELKVTDDEGLTGSDIKGIQVKNVEFYEIGGFKVTSGSYDETVDNNQACIAEYGNSYQIADWNDIVNYYNTSSSMDDFFTAVSMPSLGQEGARSLQVSRDGNELYSSSRHYFISRHDHNKPGHYLSHANIDDHLIDLGSWDGARPVLCKGNNAIYIDSNLSDNFNDGDFSSNLSWTETDFNDDINKGLAEVLNGELHIKRSGAGGNGGAHGIEIISDIDISSLTVITLDVKPVSRSVRSGCGDNCTEHPLKLRLVVEKEDGSDWIIDYGWNYDGAVREKRDFTTSTQISFSVPQGEWTRGVEIRPLNDVPNIIKIKSIALFGNGWDFESFVDNINITGSEKSKISKAKAIINAISGGTLTLDDSTTLTIPAYSLDQDTEITIEKINVVNEDGSLSNTINLYPTGTTFNNPITLSTLVDSNQNEDLIDAFILSPETAAYDDGEEELRLEPLKVSVEDNKATVEISHFSKVTLFGAKALQLIFQLPSKYLLPGDIEYNLNSNNMWATGHSRMFLGFNIPNTPQKGVYLSDSEKNNAISEIESVNESSYTGIDKFIHSAANGWGVNIDSGDGYRTSKNLYMGAKRRKDLTWSERKQIAKYAVEKEGSSYNFLGNETLFDDAYTCTGLVESSYESAGKGMTTDVALGSPLPVYQYSNPFLEDINEITVTEGDDINFPIYGSLRREFTANTGWLASLYNLTSTFTPKQYAKKSAYISSKDSGMTDAWLSSNGDFIWDAVKPKQDGTPWQITFTVKGEYNGNSYTVPRTLTIYVNEAKKSSPPVASFTNDCDDLTCTFNASSSYDPDGSVASYQWNFGDGSTSSMVYPEHNYANAGSYTVVLTVTDESSLTDTKSRLVTVNEPITSSPPVASFTNDCDNLTCTFNASSSYDPDGSVASYQWNFGDGSTSTGVNVDHSYDNAGSFTVALTVTDNSTLTDTVSESVTVNESIEPTSQYTKISSTGNILPDVSTEWSCIQDNDTGLVWEVRTGDGGLRDKSWTYMNTTNVTGPEPEEGDDYGSCLVSSSNVDGVYCQTEDYIESVNSQNLCGKSDWRLPTKNELITLVDTSLSPTINTEYFPDIINETKYLTFWTSTTGNTENPEYWGAWFINFGNGRTFSNFYRGDPRSVRLVR